ncbi:MAG: DUF4292 domain-containing protein [Bacteroidia bacterium]|nr:DUF4292 domain-containing protein [Bacteroidia bacterium]
MNNLHVTEKKTPRSFLFFLVCLLALFSLLSSCKTKKLISTAPPQHVTKKTAKELEVLLKKNEFKFEWINGKFSTDVIVDSSQTSFNVTFRGRKDSVLWMSITVPLIGMEAARVIITKDSVRFIDRLHSQYFVGDFNYIHKLLNTEIDYEMLQSLLVGNSVEFYEDEERMHSLSNNGRYLLSTIRKRKLRKVMEKNKELRDPAQSIWLNPVNFKIERILFNDFNQNRTFNAEFDKFAEVDSMLFPNTIHYSIKAQKNIDIKLEYSKINSNTPQAFPFSIPSKYERIIYKEK